MHAGFVQARVWQAISSGISYRTAMNSPLFFARQNVWVAAIDPCLFVRHLGDSFCVMGDEMRRKRVFVTLSWLSASAFLLAQALAQAPPAEQTQDIAPGPSCVPSIQQGAQSGGTREQGAARQGRGPAAQQASRNLTIIAIPGVVAAGGKWTKVWQAGGNSADGILPDKDGGVLVAQEDYDTVLKIDSRRQGVGGRRECERCRLTIDGSAGPPLRRAPNREARINQARPDVDRECRHHASARTQNDSRQMGRWHDADGTAERSRRRQPGRRVFHVGLPLLCQPERGHRSGG